METRKVVKPYDRTELSVGGYWSNTFDVFDWTDEGDDSRLFIAAQFANENDAETYANANGRSLIVRPPAQLVATAVRWIARVSEANVEGTEIRR